MEKEEVIQPKFRQKDIVKHTLTGEKFLVLRHLTSWSCGCTSHLGSGCEDNRVVFNGEYKVMNDEYKEMFFPEWQLTKYAKH